MRHARLTSVTTFARVMILFVVVLSYTLVNGAGNRWTDVNADPYRGTTKDALRAMVPFGLPESSLADVERCFKDKRFQKSEMRKGGSALVMIHGNLKKTTNVIYDWEKFSGLESEDCTAGEFLVRRALICNNFLLEKRPPMAQDRPPAVLATTTLPDMASIHVFLLKKTDETKKFVRKEFDSRDAKEFVSRAYSGKLPRHTMCLPVSLALLNFGAMTQVYAGYEGVPKAAVPFSGNGLTLNVCGGHGMVDLPASAIVESAVILATPDRTKASIYYPPSGTLRTIQGEIFRIVHKNHDMNIELFVVVD